ncbi:RDD family protein [Streptomyces flavofungini]|uniref:RDD family protein n=1 Tax=Streptomyces flavofungini TaxID=68200 RepID=UPI0025B1B387|nr:RDD family protein [Streptomyces flavofungini]WJV50385.1 RDD family protein [Streptomyces flavofungini]
MPKFRRVGAWLIDFALVVAAAGGLAALTFNRISALITDVPELMTKGSWHFVTSGGDAQGASGKMVDSLWEDAVGYIQQGFLALVVLTFLYQWLTLNFTGRTLGKALMGLRVTPRTPSRTALRAAVTTSADVAVYALACCVLVQGWLFLSVLCWIAAVALFLLNVLPVLSRSSRSLADRVAGTSVNSPGFAGIPSARRAPEQPQRDLTSSW